MFVRGHFTLASCAAILASLASTACSGPSEEAVVLGTHEQALKHDGRDGKHDGAHAAHRRHRAHRHHHHGEQGGVEEPAPEPTVFTPATAAARSGRIAGVAVDHGPLANEPGYAETVAAEFSDVVAENAMKWGPLQPDPDTWDFAAGDAIVAFAEENDMRVKGHALIWHNQLPSFINDETPPRRLARYAKRHIKRTARHYRRDVFAWDVVNEAIADDGSGLRETVFSEAFGERYIDHAFWLARLADRDAELYYNDYGIEGINAKSDAVHELMQRLLQRRVPVDGVGFQAHFDARFVPSLEEMVENFDRFGDLGLSVNVSELDVRIARLAGTTAHRRAVQKQVYQRVAAACVASAACEGVTTWGFTDKYSWIDSTFGADDPLLLDENYQRKPAYYGYVDGFLGVPLDDPSLAPNLIGNASLETGLDGWSVLGDGALATEVDQAHTGLRSAVMSGRTASWQGPRHEVTSLVRSGRSYDVSVFAQLGGAASADTHLTAQITCAGEDTQFQRLDSAAATDADWSELAGVMTLPSCELQTVAVYVEGPDAGVDVLVDDLALREQPLPNLVANSGFETGTAGWFGWGPTTVGTTTDANSGELAAIGTNRTASWNGIATNLTSSLEPTASYSASAWVKLGGAASDAIVLTAALRCAGEAQQFIRVASGTGTDSGWTELSGSVQVPNCSLEEFVLYVEGPAAGVDILLDDVAVFQLTSGLGPNVIQNSGFETDTSGWFGFGAVTVGVATDRAHSGAQSAHVSGRTATFNGLATSLVGRVTPGRSYSALGWAQVSAASDAVRFTLQASCDGAAATFTTVASATANNAGWVPLEGTLSVPDCNLTTANFYIEGPAAGVDIYLDDVSLREIP